MKLKLKSDFITYWFSVCFIMIVTKVLNGKQLLWDRVHVGVLDTLSLEQYDIKPIMV